MKLYRGSFSALCLLAIASNEIVHAQTTKTTVEFDKYTKAETKVKKCNGNEICAIYMTISPPKNSRIRAKKTHYWGYLDIDGNEVVAPRFTIARDYTESGYATVAEYSQKKKRSRYGLIDLSGDYTIPPKYDRIGTCHADRIWVIKKEKVGFLTCNGETILPLKYDAIIDYSEGFAAYKNRKGFYQVIDHNGDDIFEKTYEAISKFHNGIAYVKDKGKWFLIDKNGTNLTQALPYDSISQYHEGLYKVKLGELYGKINQSGEIVIPVEYNSLHKQSRYKSTTVTVNGQETTYGSTLDPNIIYARKGRLWGLFDITGNVILPVEFADIETIGFINGLIRVIDKTDKILYFDKNGKQSFPDYELPWAFDNHKINSSQR